METAEITSFDWKVKKVNDIDTNPIECWWTIGECGTLKRFYKIVPFPAQDERGLVISENKYFVLFEGLGIESDMVGIVGIYESLDLAKARAKVQLVHIVNLIEIYCSELQEKSNG